MAKFPAEGMLLEVIDFNTFTEPISDGAENEKDEQFLGLSEHISCPLCGDFLSDAVTLTGCLHFFCRLCLLRHLSSESASKNCCPKCDVQLGPEKPFFHRDPALQELVFKLVPDIFWRRLARVARSRRRSSRKSLSERHILKRRRLIQLSTALCSPDEKISVQIDYVPLAEVLAANRNLMEPTPSTSSKAVADTKKQLFFRRFFRCAARVRIEQLKRLLELKLAMTDSYGLYFVDGALQNVLEDDYTLENIVHLFNWNRESPLPLLFTLAKLAQEDEDKPPVLEEMPQLEVEGDPAIVSVRKSAEKSLVGEELMDGGGTAAERKESGDGPKRAETSAPALPKGPTTPDSPQLSLGTSQPCLLPSTSSETLPNSSSSLPMNAQTNKKDRRKKKDIGCAAKKQQSPLVAKGEESAKKRKTTPKKEEDSRGIKRKKSKEEMSGGGGREEKKQGDEEATTDGISQPIELRGSDWKESGSDRNSVQQVEGQKEVKSTNELAASTSFDKDGRNESSNGVTEQQTPKMIPKQQPKSKPTKIEGNGKKNTQPKSVQAQKNSSAFSAHQQPVHQQQHPQHLHLPGSPGMPPFPSSPIAFPAAVLQNFLQNGTVADAFGVAFANAFLAQQHQQLNQMIGGMMEKATPQNGSNTKGNNDNISKACGGTSSVKPTREDRPSMVGQAPTSSGTNRCLPMPTSSIDHHNGNIGGSAVQKAKASSHCIYPKGRSDGLVTNVAQHQLKQQQKPQHKLMLNDQASRHAASVLKATLPG
uniref:RING-type domain-containing protein n=1 Tax=Globodera rostochiensis TaxID=31243 RepID=A0A914GXF2_GLORO